MTSRRNEEKKDFGHHLEARPPSGPGLPAPAPPAAPPTKTPKENCIHNCPYFTAPRLRQCGSGLHFAPPKDKTCQFDQKRLLQSMINCNADWKEAELLKEHLCTLFELYPSSCSEGANKSMVVNQRRTHTKITNEQLETNLNVFIKTVIQNILYKSTDELGRNQLNDFIDKNKEKCRVLVHKILQSLIDEYVFSDESTEELIADYEYNDTIFSNSVVTSKCSQRRQEYKVIFIPKMIVGDQTERKKKTDNDSDGLTYENIISEILQKCMQNESTSEFSCTIKRLNSVCSYDGDGLKNASKSFELTENLPNERNLTTKSCVSRKSKKMKLALGIKKEKNSTILNIHYNGGLAGFSKDKAVITDEMAYEDRSFKGRNRVKSEIVLKAAIPGVNMCKDAKTKLQSQARIIQSDSSNYINLDESAVFLFNRCGILSKIFGFFCCKGSY